ncbi:MAG: prepilin-type N-terminal cleavage/methylation domain-containing protein [Candidatus Sumerlaeia bacterium]|nr:prepilin-type N-terminal cleavage/methylation domain-containing protein [Candidatus Sumerlaeia bacterium]
MKLDSHPTSPKAAFTLIELLIVVAIIAILAAIAVPNFLEAQTRSKVSRVKADLRTVTTALESYYVDNNKYPPTPFSNGDTLVLRVIPTRLSTPIAYITSAGITDPFLGPNVGDFQIPSVNTPGLIITYSGFGTEPEGYDPNAGQRYYYNHNGDIEPRRSAGVVTALQAAQPIEGLWAMASFGPNRTRDFAPSGLPGNPSVLVPYDPTNGSVSGGDIVRTQKQPEGTLQ